MFSSKYSLEHLCRIVKGPRMFITLAVVLYAGAPAYQGWAQAANAAAGPDVLTLSNGDHLAGKLVSEANGPHSDGAGDLNLTWDKIKSIQTAGKYAVVGPEGRS